TERQLRITGYFTNTTVRVDWGNYCFLSIGSKGRMRTILVRVILNSVLFTVTSKLSDCLIGPIFFHETVISERYVQNI
ncbi:hypothetical protein C0J52_25253, partial [Blattella germanica]